MVFLRKDFETLVLEASRKVARHGVGETESPFGWKGEIGFQLLWHRSPIAFLQAFGKKVVDTVNSRWRPTRRCILLGLVADVVADRSEQGNEDPAVLSGRLVGEKGSNIEQSVQDGKFAAGAVEGGP